MREASCLFQVKRDVHLHWHVICIANHATITHPAPLSFLSGEILREKKWLVEAEQLLNLGSSRWGRRKEQIKKFGTGLRMTCPIGEEISLVKACPEAEPKDLIRKAIALETNPRRLAPALRSHKRLDSFFSK